MNSSKINFGVLWCLVLVASSSAAKWSWPDGEAAASVRIDTKVSFTDTNNDKNKEKDLRRVQADEVPFSEPLETDGFYNRPAGAGRYPVRVEDYRAPYRTDGHGIYSVNNQQQQNQISDGTLDSLQYCKCVSRPDCNPRPESASACGHGQFLCCYPRPSNSDRLTQQNNQYYNEVGDQGPAVFPRPPGSAFNGQYGSGSYGQGQGHDSSNIGAFDRPLGVLVGPGGPTGVIGPQDKQKQPAVLVGPGGPTGIVGPANGDGLQSPTAQRGVYFGSGILGSYGQRPVLVGPGGPTGIIGPGRGGRRPNVLVGPGGPTGIIGPGYNRQPGLLTGPGGPTGSIGPRRQVLVGPGGPTGQIGPQGFYGK